MSLESDLVALLDGFAASRIFPDVAPFETPRPYIVYQQIGGQAVGYVGNEIPNSENAIVQIAVWDDTRAGARALSRQIEDALRLSAAFSARPVAAPVSQHEPDLERYGTLQDFSIWAAR